MAGYSVTFTVVDQATRQIDQINRRIQQLRAPLEHQARAVSRFVDVTGLRSLANGFSGIAQQAAGAFSSISRLVPAMGAVTAAGTVAGIVKLTQSWASLGTQLQDIGDLTGTTANNVEHLQNVARVAGGNVDDMTQSLIGLTNKLYDAQLAKDPAAVAAFNRLGVAIRDSHGQFRTATDVLPELIAALDRVQDPADRMRLAVATGGDSLFKLTSEIERAQRPGETLTETWRRLNEQARIYDQNIDAGKLQAYREAVGALDASFNSLKIELGTTLSTALTPLITEFGTWVNTHQPQIIRAVETVVNIFKSLIGALGGPDEGGAGGGIGGVVGAAALVVAAFGPIKFAAGIINSIGSITTAIGTVGSLTATGGVIGGIGLLGALGGIIILSLEIIRHWDEIKRAGSDMIDAAVAGWDRLKNSISDTTAMARGFRGEGTPEQAAMPEGPPGPPRPTGGPTPFSGGAYGAAGHEEFLNQAWPLAIRESERTGLDPRLIIAQAALESGWGTSRRATQESNFFGIKGAGPGGKEFAKYKNMDESFRAYGDLMLTERYKNVRQAQGLQNQLDALGVSPYTPDIGYAPQVGAIAAGLGGPGGPGAGATGGGAGVAQGVNAALTGALTQAFGVLPAGYTAAITSGVRKGDPTSQHYTGSALDFQISGPQGPLANKGEDVSGLYRQVQVATLANLMQSNPELAKSFASGFAFETSKGSGVRDIMHVDVGGRRGRLEDPSLIHRQAAALLASSNGQPRQVTGGAPVSGAVDVNITHRNPPPGTTLTATSTGDVNVPAPKTEQQQFAFA